MRENFKLRECRENSPGDVLKSDEKGDNEWAHFDRQSSCCMHQATSCATRLTCSIVARFERFDERK